MSGLRREKNRKEGKKKKTMGVKEEKSCESSTCPLSALGRSEEEERSEASASWKFGLSSELL